MFRNLERASDMLSNAPKDKKASRSDFLKLAGAVGTTLILGHLGSSTAGAEESRGYARIEAEPGRFYPDGAGLRELFNKFNDAHERVTGENNLYEESPLNKWLKKFERTHNSAEGICNGLANANITKEKPFPSYAYLGDILFQKDEIIGLYSALHIGDSAKPERFTLGGVTKVFHDEERADPIFLDGMVGYHLRQRGEGICIDFSPYRDQMWSRMVDQSTHNYTNLGGGLIRVDLQLRTNGYIERGERFHFFRIGYEINIKDINQPGHYIYGNRPQSVWFPDSSRQNREFNVRDNVFTPLMIESLTTLTGFTQV